MFALRLRECLCMQITFVKSTHTHTPNQWREACFEYNFKMFMGSRAVCILWEIISLNALSPPSIGKWEIYAQISNAT